MYKFNKFIAILFFMVTARIAWGHGLPIYISSDGKSMITISEAPFENNLNLFVDEFGDPNESGGLVYTNEGSPFALSVPSPPTGYNAFPAGTTFGFNMTSPLYYSSGGLAASAYVDPTNPTHNTSQPDGSVYITIVDEDQSNPPTINVYGNAMPTPGYSFAADDDGHELIKILSNSSASGAYGFGFTVTAKLPGSGLSITSAPLADVFFTDGFDDDAAAASVYNAIMRGDFNLDGQKTSADISLMMQALTNPGAFQANNNLSNIEFMAIADVNQDGQITNADLQSLLLLLKSGGQSANTVPEPSGLALMASALGVFIWRRWRE